MFSRRNTTQRKLIYDELRNSCAHATAAEIYQSVRLRVPRLSLSTVYRNLKILHDEGLVKKIKGPSHETRYDALTDKHYHLHCVKCGRLEDVVDPVTVRVEGRIRSAAGWKVSPPQIEFPGLCPNCRGDVNEETSREESSPKIQNKLSDRRI